MRVYMHVYTRVYMRVYMPMCKCICLGIFIEGSLEVKLPTVWTDGKAEVERVSEREKVRRKKAQVREKAKHCVFAMICGSRWSKVGSLKRRVRRHLAR